jgi:hypothetical protein
MKGQCPCLQPTVMTIAILAAQYGKRAMLLAFLPPLACDQSSRDTRDDLTSAADRANRQ